MLASCVLSNILVKHHVVCSLYKCIETDIDLSLPCGPDLVMLRLDRYAELLEQERHLAANILERIVGSDGEVSFFHPHAMAKVGSTIARTIPVRFIGVYLCVLYVVARIVTHIVEDVELSLRPKIGGVRDPTG